MLRFVLGLIVGAVLTAAYFIYLVPQDDQLSQIPERVLQDPIATQPVRPDTLPGVSDDQLVSDSGQLGSQRDDSTSEFARLTTEPVDAQSRPARQPGPPAANAPPVPVTKLDVAEEIAPLLEEGGRVTNLHRQFESERREDSWSAYMEAQIQQYLAAKPALAAFNIVLVECRTSICEIHAIGYGPDANVVWTTEVSDIVEQSWFEFTGMSGSVRNVEPDVDILGILMILHKNTE